MIEPQPSALLTDLYQLTMLQAYIEAGQRETAVFEFFMRKLPPERNFLIAAGLEQVLQFLERLQFQPDELNWLARCGHFQPKLLDYLKQFRFTGAVHAMPEGTIFFPDEPILRVTAPIAEAQFVESRIINLLHFQTLIASKAARSVLTAPGKTLVDFGMRRAHGAEAALLAARAAYLTGFSGTATVLAGVIWNIPLYGTMAHSFIQLHRDETQAFEDFARANPGNVVFLLDTYDTEAAAEKVARLAKKLMGIGIKVLGVRLDSGDLGEHARRVRRILDAANLTDLTIFASGNLDEYALAKLNASGAPIDGFGIGTRLDASADVPYLDCAYKIQEYAGRPLRKRSEGKATWPGQKQVYRSFDSDGRMSHDVVALETESRKPAPSLSNEPALSLSNEGEPLLRLVMEQGRRIAPPVALEAARSLAADNLSRLPAALRSLEPATPHDVRISPGIHKLAKAVDLATDGGKL
jgi:nicotinate phosphoribosyltransferase